MKVISPQDALYFYIEQRQQPMHVASLQIFTPPKGRGRAGNSDFVQKLYQSWREHITSVAPFNRRPLHKPGRWLWDEDKDFDVDYHLRHLALPKPGRIRELLALVGQLHATLLDRNRPLWEIYLIEGLDDGRFAIYSKMHHGLIDGVTGIRMISAALSTNPKETKAPLWALEYNKRENPLEKAQRVHKSTFEKVLAVLEKSAQIVPGLRSGIADLINADKTPGAIALPFQAPPTMFNVRITGSRRFVAQSWSLSRMKRIGAATGATVNDVTLALCASALRSYLLAQKALPKKPLIAMVPVSLAGEGEKSGKGGNQVGAIMANLATNEADPLKRLAKIVASTSAAKDRLRSMSALEKMAHAAMGLAPMLPDAITGKSGKRPAFNVVISNVPGAKEPLYLNGAHLDEAYPVSIPADFQALNITVSSNGDDFGFGFIACRRTVPGLQRMVDYMDAAFVELEAAIGND